MGIISLHKNRYNDPQEYDSGDYCHAVVKLRLFGRKAAAASADDCLPV